MTDFISEGAASTIDFGRTLGELLMPGDFIALFGDLGAGKTQFAKGVAQGVGVPADETVCSPSYTILNVYEGRIPFYHFDLYRLSDEGQVSELGFDEYFAGNGASVVEWADRLGGQIPNDSLRVVFTIEGPERRRLSFGSTGARSAELLRSLSAVSHYKSV